METFKEYIEKLDKLEFEKMYENDFFLTWEKTRDELEAVFTVADTLRYLRAVSYTHLTLPTTI
ncbi:hypothetical protein KQJ30_31380, partial [Enterococcus sp. S157_ASV_20]|nr:hypothetical protein [Enterococcus sp. S157_ASV_20]